jgi:hypothetical protein
MRRTVLSFGLAVLVLGGAPAVQGAGLEEALEQRWVGAWVVTAVETASDCAGFYTNNEVRGRLVASKGRRRFAVGELARVDKLNQKSDRVDLFLTLAEPILASRQDGPFTLLDEHTCKVQLMVFVPAGTLKAGNVAVADEALRATLERYATREQALASPHWNGRQREPYPADYELTVARHAAWQAEQQNAQFIAQRDRAGEDAWAALARVANDADYLAGFAAGVERLRGWRPSGCPALAGATLSQVEGRPPRERSSSNAADSSWRRGFHDGQELAFALAVQREVERCLVPVPAVTDR